MIQDIEPHQFHIEYFHYYPRREDTVLVCRGQSVLLKQNGRGMISFPKVENFPEGEMRFRYLFRIDEERFFLGIPSLGKKAEEIQKWVDFETGEEHCDFGQDFPVPSGYRFENIRIFRGGRPVDRAFAGMVGCRLAQWYEESRFCGHCGVPMVHDEKERMMRCPKCGRTRYPVICPAVIVAVVHNGKLLMSRYAGRSYKNYALIAGFAETGETIEQTVHREVMEEVGLPVRNLHFYKSQPWAFTGTLLMGFFCELDGSDETITLEEDELSEAGWFLPEQVPEDEEHCSLTSEMMEVFRRGEHRRYLSGQSL